MKIKYDFSDVLMIPKVSQHPLDSRSQIKIDIKHKSYSGLPLIVSNMPSIGTYDIARILSKEKIVTFIYKDHLAEYHIEQLKKVERTDYIGLTTGVRDTDVDRLLKVIKERQVGFINLDTANIYGNFEFVLRKAEILKKRSPESLLVIGNICTPEVVKPLIDVGADLIKVGVGPGSVCTTRSQVGVGVPQFSAVQEVVKEAKGSGVGIISDGGCIESGDVCKALGAGADFVMLGGMLASSIECGNKVMINGDPHINFWGLGSVKQFEQTFPSDEKYRPNEGRNLMIPCDGSILDKFQQIKGALRSACTYLGTDRVEKLRECAEFIQVTGQLNKSLAKYEV